MNITHYIAEVPRSEPLVPTIEGRVSDPRPSLRRLVNLIQAILPDRPIVTAAIEQCIETIVVDELRHRIQDRLLRLSPEDLAKVEALTAQLAGDDTPSPDDEAA